MNNNAVAASNAFLKSNKLRGYQKLTNPTNEGVMDREMYYKN